MSFAYYNEIDPFAAEWLRALVAAGVIADGEVDTRPIQDVDTDDLRGFTQCHFFAGIGVWSFALRQAGWPDDQPVWTGSCPCQPFSASGKKKKFNDDRHLWPYWYGHILEHRPAILFGEQVAGKDALPWLDLVQTQMEDQDYAFAPFDLCVAGVGGPHIRQRIFFVADTLHERRCGGKPWGENAADAGQSSETGSLEYAESAAGRLSVQQRRSQQQELESRGPSEVGGRPDCVMGDADRAAGDKGSSIRGGSDPRSDAEPRAGSGGASGVNKANPLSGFWADADWIYCRDEKFRPVEPGTFPLVTGAPARVGRLRGYGNAINAEVATAFIEAYCEARSLTR